ncbi:MAG: hypothetical protein JO119_10310 [Acidobacteria bacterium]|nr:hypothetical protein [Acidobacteriota bacterium]
MFLSILICFLINQLSLSLGILLPLLQMNAAILAVGLFAFIGLRLCTDARARERRFAAALLVW